MRLVVEQIFIAFDADEGDAEQRRGEQQARRPAGRAAPVAALIASTIVRLLVRRMADIDAAEQITASCPAWRNCSG